MSETREAMIRRAVIAMQESKAWPSVFRPETGRALAQAAVDASAAPDLAEALADTLRMLEAAHRTLGMRPDDNKRVAKARAALARAKGASGLVRGAVETGSAS